MDLLIEVCSVHKVHMYPEYHSVCPLVRIGTHTPFPKRVCPPGTKGGYSHTARIPSPLPLRVAKTGRNHLNEKFTPLLPTGIGERF
jgi:hypothetical protein